MTKNNFQYLHHFLLALTALLYTTSTSLELYHNKPQWQLLTFVFTSTFLVYRLATNRPIISFQPFKITFQSKNNKRFFFLVFLLVLILFILLPLLTKLIAVFMGVITLLYFLQWNINGKTQSGLRSVPLLKNIVLALVWTSTTIWLSIQNLENINEIYYLFITRFIYILAICLGVDLRDWKIDQVQKTTTLPVLYGFNKIKIVAIILLLLFVTLVFLKSQLFELPVRNNYRSLVQITSGILSIICLVSLSEKHSYNRYTIMLDGNMFLQALLLGI